MTTHDVRPLYDTLRAAREQLVASGVPAPEAEIDVDLFARTILGWDRARLITDRNDPPPDGLQPRFSQWVARRIAREPTAYIVQSREFWGLDFLVTPAVLVPRPETEFVVEETLQLLGEAPPSDGVIRIADIGTGSGCIAVSLAHERANLYVTATDVSTEALAVARANAERHGVLPRMNLVATSYLDGIATRFAVIAANPPYVRDTDKPALSADVRHEPDVALFGGVSGLRDIEGVLDTAVDRLVPGGWLVMEFGFGQEDDVRGLAGKRPALRVERIREDLQGIARTAVIRRT